MTHLYTRTEASAYIASTGLRMSPRTLSRLSSQGAAPKYALIGNKFYYRKEWLDEWIEDQLIPIHHPIPP